MLAGCGSGLKDDVTERGGTQQGVLKHAVRAPPCLQPLASRARALSRAEGSPLLSTVHSEWGARNELPGAASHRAASRSACCASPAAPAGAAAPASSAPAGASAASSSSSASASTASASSAPAAASAASSSSPPSSSSSAAPTAAVSSAPAAAAASSRGPASLPPAPAAAAAAASAGVLLLGGPTGLPSPLSRRTPLSRCSQCWSAGVQEKQVSIALNDASAGPGQHAASAGPERRGRAISKPAQRTPLPAGHSHAVGWHQCVHSPAAAASTSGRVSHKARHASCRQQLWQQHLHANLPSPIPRPPHSSNASRAPRQWASHSGTLAFHARRCPSANRGTRGARGALKGPPASTSGSLLYQACNGRHLKGTGPPGHEPSCVSKCCSRGHRSRPGGAGVCVWGGRGGSSRPAGGAGGAMLLVLVAVAVLMLLLEEGHPEPSRQHPQPPPPRAHLRRRVHPHNLGQLGPVLPDPRRQQRHAPHQRAGSGGLAVGARLGEVQAGWGVCGGVGGRGGAGRGGTAHSGRWADGGAGPASSHMAGALQPSAVLCAAHIKPAARHCRRARVAAGTVEGLSGMLHTIYRKPLTQC